MAESINMKPYAYYATENVLNLILDGESYLFTADSPQYKALLTAITADKSVEEIQKLLKASTVIVKYSDGDLTVMSDGTIKRKGKILPPSIATRVYNNFNAGLPYKNLLNFFDRCEANETYPISIAEGLFHFLEHEHMPITPQGTVLGYRGVTADYKDKWTGTFDNSIGQCLFMPHSKVEHNPDISCGPGFHIGSLEYAKDWAGSTGKVIIVEFDPIDVVSVPARENAQKLRASRFWVRADYKGPLPSLFVKDVHDPYVGMEEGEDFWDDEDDDNTIHFREG